MGRTVGIGKPIGVRFADLRQRDRYVFSKSSPIAAKRRCCRQDMPSGGHVAFAFGQAAGFI